MADYSNRSVLILDHGGFVHVAEACARWFGKVRYWCPWEDNFPRSQKRDIGAGLPGVERVYDEWEAIKKSDLLIFPDASMAGLQTHLRESGQRVWGCGESCAVERDRAGLKKVMASLKMPVNEYIVVKGMTALRKLIDDGKHEGWFIKLEGERRGDTETRKIKRADIMQDWLGRYASGLGWRAEKQSWIVEAPVEGEEFGYDGACIAGKYLDPGMYGVEDKDAGYVGATSSVGDMPRGVQYVNRVLGQVLAKFGMRGWWSTEVRLSGKDGTPYLIDPCCRMGSPPGEAMMEMFKNWPDILWNGAAGEIVPAIPAAAYCVESIIMSQMADRETVSVHYPKDVAPFVKLKNKTITEGTARVLWQEAGLCGIGAVVATGETLPEAIKKLRGYIDKIDGEDVTIRMDGVEHAISEIRAGCKTLGFKFGKHSLPSEEEVRRAMKA